MMSLSMTSWCKKSSRDGGGMVEGEIHGAVNGGVNDGSYLPPESVPLDFYGREIP